VLYFPGGRESNYFSNLYQDSKKVATKRRAWMMNGMTFTLKKEDGSAAGMYSSRGREALSCGYSI
jgi:hypothetical protein